MCVSECIQNYFIKIFIGKKIISTLLYICYSLKKSIKCSGIKIYIYTPVLIMKNTSEMY